jgi:hypothetical protein
MSEYYSKDSFDLTDPRGSRDHTLRNAALVCYSTSLYRKLSGYKFLGNTLNSPPSKGT